MSYSDLEYEIFSRQFILKDFNQENIVKLNKTKVAIIGLGGIGCSLSQYIVSSGFKNLVFFDAPLIPDFNPVKIGPPNDCQHYEIHVWIRRQRRTSLYCGSNSFRDTIWRSSG